MEMFHYMLTHCALMTDLWGQQKAQILPHKMTHSFLRWWCWCLLCKYNRVE